MRVTGTVDEYVALAAITDPGSRHDAWISDYEAAHPEVFDAHYRSWSSPDHRPRGVENVPIVAPAVRRLEERAYVLASRTEREFRQRGLLDELTLFCWWEITPRTAGSRS